MRFIRLDSKPGKTAYENVLKHGCGPKFVMHRRQIFDAMITEQGKKFWFRFWFTFCHKPEKELEPVVQKYPEQFCYCYNALHEEFVGVTINQAIKFCWTVVFPTKKCKQGQKKVSCEDNSHEDQNEIFDMVMLSFSIALCDVFYKWLLACDGDYAHRDYWSIPSIYLSDDFIPRPLEYFLVSFWDEDLLDLLGIQRVAGMQWLVKLLNEKRNCNIEDEKCKQAAQKTSEKLKAYIIKTKAQLNAADRFI